MAHRQPLSLLSKERVKVVVTMNGESVAEVRALAPDHVVSRADHDAIEARVSKQHAALEPAIVSRGGKVLAHYHAAMNGMKIEIARGEVAGLSSLPGVVQVVPVPKYTLKNTVSVPYIGAPAVWQGAPGGHGSHVSGTATGFGVANDGTTYHGPYNEAVYSTGFMIGPGVAPLADLYMVRVFGCTGSTDVVSDAIEWAVENDMDVISMSLGSAYGPASSSDSVAADNAAKAGIIVVAAAGNEGPAPYVTGDPGSATHAISVAAMNARPFLANGLNIAFSSGSSVNGVEADTLALPNGACRRLS